MKHIKKITLACSCLFFGMAHAANPEPVIYGTVITNSNEQTTGTIRWGEQEMWLSDIFNGLKKNPVGIEHFTAEQKQALEDHQPGPQARIGGLQVTFKSFFGKDIKRPYYNLPFGAIAKLEIDTSNDKYQVTLHDGVTIDAAGDTNDLTDDIFVLTAEGNTVEYDMDSIKTIDFSQAPVDAKLFDDGIYGVLTTHKGEFNGRFMWDQDERGHKEKLDGYDENKTEYDIKFGDIKSIERKGNKSLVTLTDDSTLLLDGTNDVDESNRGLWMYHPDTGRVEIKWDDFVKLDMTDVDVKWMSFSDYQKISKPLSGTITLADNSSLKVTDIAYDLNQQSGLELLEVEIMDHDHFIPFRKIQKITKNNTTAVDLLLTNGEKHLAYGENSVTRDNNGIFAKQGNEYRWIMWKDVQSISFD